MLGWVVASVIGLLALFLIASFVVNGKREYRMAIFMEHLEGMEGVPYREGVSVRVQPDKKYVEMEYKEEKNLLPFRQIVNVNIITWEKTITKALNPMAEGIVGGIIGGETMAVVSAIDAKGRTRAEKVKLERALEIQYHPKGDFRTVKKLVFWDKYDFAQKKDTIQFANTLCHYANLPAPQYITPQPKGPTYL